MADTLKLRRGNTSACNSFTGVEGEIVIDTTKKTVVVQDGTAGGEALMKESGATAASTITFGTGGTTALTIDGSQDTNIPDGKKIKLGAGSDLLIYHDGGSQSYIKDVTGDLKIIADADDLKLMAEDDIVLRDNDDATNFIHCINGGAVNIFYSGVEKLATTSTGAKVTGSLQLTDALKLFDVLSPNDHNVDIWSVNDTCTVAAFGTDGAFQVKTGSGPNIALTIDSSRDATFTGVVDLNPNTVSTAGSPTLKITNGSAVSGGKNYSLRPNIPGVSNTGFTIYNESDERNELSIDGSGNTTFEGNIKLAATKGINFSNYGAEEDPDVTATDVTSNTLTDYEEGTFMPTLAQGGDDGSGGAVNYSLRSGHYTKIGNKVHVDFYMYFASDTKSTGALYVVGGLPFSTKNANYIRGGGCTTFHTLATDAGGSNAVAAFYGSTDSTQVQVYQGSTQVKGADGSDLGGKYLIGFFEYLSA